MDSYSQSPRFLNFLNSQQPKSQHPHQYVSGSPSVDELGASDVFVLGREWAEDAHTVNDRKERQKWSPTEDVVLISAWLNISKDNVVENEQKAIEFWKQIAAYFASSPKFAGCCDYAVKEKSSGQNENDVMKMAHVIFFNDYKVKFTLEHAWLEFRHDQKWCGPSSTKENLKSKRIKMDDQFTQSSTSMHVGEDEPIARPVGVKAAKAKSKRSIWQKDYIMKEKLNKQKLLNSPIEKIEPLNEIEIALKNKLINDILAS
ncbi:hypothetical protein N665_0008s0278 [Sinapis alba]|nr:hypothetical protein N665_0008s0278 [Sinapis alba]